MAHSLLISDLHLDPQRPAAIQRFVRLTQGAARRAEALYILGDLFEVWVGDDDDGPHGRQVSAALRALAQHGTPVYLMHGNRDFLIGEIFAQACAATLLPDPSVVNLDGVDTVLTHGDSLCWDDPAYTAFRRQTRSPQWQRALLAKPVAARRALAHQLRQQSDQEKHLKSADIMDITPAAAERLMGEYGVTRLIHGHTHRPRSHALRANGKPAQRHVLADWSDAYGEALHCDAQGCRRIDV